MNPHAATHRRRRRAHGGKGGAEPRATIEARREQILRLTIEGCSQHEIARRLRISQPTVSKTLRKLAEQQAAANKEAFQQHLFVMEKKYGHLYQQALAGWEQSRQPRTRRTQRKHAGGDPQGVAAEIQVADSPGDPRFLEQARKAVEKLELIQGLTPVLRKGRPGLTMPLEGPHKLTPSVVEVLREKLLKASARYQQEQAEKAKAAQTTVDPSTNGERG